MKLVKEMEMANGGGALAPSSGGGREPVKDFGVERRKKSREEVPLSFGALLSS